MNARSKTNIRFNGREYANADEMPSDVRAAYDRAVDELGELHSGARLAAKLNAKIIVDGNEFSNAGRNVSGRSTFISRSARGAVPARHCHIRGWGRRNQRRETLADHGRDEEALIASCKSSSAKTLTSLRRAVGTTAATTFRVTRSLA